MCKVEVKEKYKKETRNESVIVMSLQAQKMIQCPPSFLSMVHSDVKISFMIRLFVSKNKPMYLTYPAQPALHA